MIGHDVCIEVMAVTSGNRVKLGIHAPSGVEVWREELLSRMASQAAHAALQGQEEPIEAMAQLVG